MSKIEVNAIEPQSGTTITIGASGDTVNLVGTLQTNGSPLPGDISSVIAGTGLSGGGTTGDVTLNVVGGTGITANANDIAIDNTVATLDGSQTLTNKSIVATQLTGTIADARITGTYTGITGLDLTDNSKIRLGTGNDLEIFHSATSGNSFIRDVGTGMMILGSDGTGVLVQKTDGETMGKFLTDGAVELYHNNAKKFETTSAGATVTGNFITSGDEVKIGTTTDSWSGANGLVIKEASGDGGITIVSASTSNNGNIGFADTQSGGFSDMRGLITYLHNGDSFRFMTANAERMRLNSTGLALKTSTPAVTLDVRATSFTPYNTNTSLIVEAPAVFSQAQHFYIYNAGAYNNSRPTGGIGAVNASSLISLSAGSICTANPGADGFKATATSSSLYDIGSGNHEFKTKTGLTVGDQFTHQTKMIIKDNGRVGIGTTSPAENLQVMDTAASKPQIRLETSDGGNKRLDLYVDGSIGTIASDQSAQSLAFRTANSERMRIDSSGRVMIGTTTADGILKVSDTDNETYLVVKNAKSGGSGEGVLSLKNDVGNWQVKVFTDDSFRIRDNANGADRFTIDTSGNVLIKKTTSGFNTAGFEVKSGDEPIYVTTENNSNILVNRRSSDGSLIRFYRSTSEKGSISVSGETVSYNGFTGSHWSRFTDNSKPTILRGTVLETLDEMLDWYNLEYNITTTTKDEDGNDVTNTETFGVPHVLTDSQSVGDTITYNHEGTDVQATIVKEADVKHMMSKVSDTTDAKNVYGVFNCYDEEQSEEGYNDFLVASVGSFLVRIKANETIAKGDLLQSNGDGTAKVQSDDNIKSSSFAKVLSTTIIETYEDGSYIVPCSLMC